MTRQPQPHGGGWKKSLTALLRQHNARRSDGRTASDATRKKRGEVLFLGFTQLRAMGYRLEDVSSFAGRHMQALVDHWVTEKRSSAVMQNRISIFRQFAEWIGKHGMVEASIRYVDDPALVTRTSVATSDKSWSTRGFDPDDIVERVRQIDARMAMALALQAAFGLRPREAWMLRPWLAEVGQTLDICRGAKNGLRRVVEIRTAHQRQVLEQAKALVQSKDESIGDPALTLEQVRNRFYTVLRKARIGRKHGITAYGLRHEAANDHFKAVSGYASPVQGGPVPADKVTERFARLETAEFLGHSRERITTHYLGRHRKKTPVGPSD